LTRPPVAGFEVPDDTGLVGVIAMVPGWEHSGGATIEHETAKQQGLKIVYFK